MKYLKGEKTSAVRCQNNDYFWCVVTERNYKEADGHMVMFNFFTGILAGHVDVLSKLKARKLYNYVYFLISHFYEKLRKVKRAEIKSYFQFPLTTY
jgi:hypothetical protein